jgi:membrane protease YdiL (CAAX protease family)
LSFKARPIKLDDFETFLLKPEDEWRLYADNLILAIEREVLHTNYCIDFQLLIRICYIVRLCLEVKEKRYKVGAAVTADLINQILNLPILLPPMILNARCSEDCSARNKMEIPKSDHNAAIAARNPCECKCDETCQKPSDFCICIKPYIGDLFLVKEELARFEEGDIADIENILAGEKKVRRHRTLMHSETSTETETETVTSEERDHEVNEKFSLQSEVKSTVDEKVNVDGGVTATLKYGDAVTLTPHANVTANFAKSESQSVARSYAKDLVDRSVSKIQEKVRKLQISKVISEVEEKNLHSIDNTQPGADHRAGIYYWVNKVSHAQVYNYGKHMMFDVIVPEPAAIFKKLYEERQKRQGSAEADGNPAGDPTEHSTTETFSRFSAYCLGKRSEMEIESTHIDGRGWRDSIWLVLVEVALVIAIYIGRQHHILKVSATPYLFLLAWISLRLRRVQWKQLGFTRYRTWAKTLLLGIAFGVGLELFDLFGKQPLLTRLLGKPPDLSNFIAVRGNLKFALVAIALIWILAAFGEELVYRGYLMNRVADLGRGTRTAWIVSLFVISALFGFSHYQQGLTGIIEEGSDGLILGLMYLAYRRNLAIPIVAHGVCDTIDIALLFLGKYPGL